MCGHTQLHTETSKFKYTCKELSEQNLRGIWPAPQYPSLPSIMDADLLRKLWLLSQQS